MGKLYVPLYIRRNIYTLIVYKKPGNIDSIRVRRQKVGGDRSGDRRIKGNDR